MRLIVWHNYKCNVSNLYLYSVYTIYKYIHMTWLHHLFCIIHCCPKIMCNCQYSRERSESIDHASCWSSCYVDVSDESRDETCLCMIWKMVLGWCELECWSDVMYAAVSSSTYHHSLHWTEWVKLRSWSESMCYAHVSDEFRSETCFERWFDWC